MTLLTTFGIFAVSSMLICYAFRRRTEPMMEHQAVGWTKSTNFAKPGARVWWTASTLQWLSRPLAKSWSPSHA
jgi:hypothetical protein